MQTKFDLMEQGGAYLRALYPHGDWIFAGVVIVVVIALALLSGGKPVDED